MAQRIGDHSEQLTALSLVLNPLSDIDWTALELNAFYVGLKQKLHIITADHLYFRKFNGGCVSVIGADCRRLQIDSLTSPAPFCNPLPDVCRAILERDAVDFAERKKSHSVLADECYILQVQSDATTLFF